MVKKITIRTGKYNTRTRPSHYEGSAAPGAKSAYDRLGFKEGEAVAIGGTGVKYTAEAQAVIDLMPVDPSPTEKGLIEQYIIDQGDNWDLIDDLYFGGFSDDANKLMGWKTGVSATVLAGTPTSITGGFEYDGVNDVHDFKFVAGIAAGQNCIVDNEFYSTVLLDVPPAGSFGYFLGFRKRYGTQVYAAFGKPGANTLLAHEWTNIQYLNGSHTYQKGIYSIYARDVANRTYFNTTQIHSANNTTGVNENAKWMAGAAADQTASGQGWYINPSPCKLGFHQWGASIDFDRAINVSAIQALFLGVGIDIT